MFSKISRYHKVADVTAVDQQGRLLASKDLRMLPQVTGTFRHTVDAGDRLDLLAFKYYGQPLQWWHICDANPEFLSPLALLGKEVIATTSFPVTVAASNPPWATLFRELQSVLGVEKVEVLEDMEIVPQQQVVSGQQVTVSVEWYSWAVRVTYNQLNVNVGTLADRIEAAGFVVGEPVDIGRLGQQIAVPPKVIG